MLKKLIIFISSLFVFLNINIALSNESNLLPVKKPKLSDQELKKKILINFLKPLPKPIIVENKNPTNEIVKKEIIKPKFLIPKKKTADCRI